MSLDKKTVEEFLKDQTWKYREASGKEFNVETCFKCGDSKWHFYVNWNTGFWYCHKADCEASGNWYMLLRETGKLIPVRRAFDDYENEKDYSKEFSKLLRASRRLHKHEAARNYLLNTRKFSPSTLNTFKVGVTDDSRGETWISYPYIVNGKLVNCKYRKLGDKKFRRLPGGKSSLYNEDYTSENSNRRILIVEGETDTLAVHSHGIPWVVGVSIGAKGINSEWIDKLDKYKQIYISFDSDIPGQIGAQKLAKRLGYERCLKVELPTDIKDVADYFSSGHTKQDFFTLLRRAKPFEVENVTTIRSALLQVINEFRYRGKLDIGLHLPWKSVDNKLGSLLSGDLIVLSGIPGVGKSTLALNVAHNFAYTQGIPTLFISLEMRPERLARKIMSLHTDKEEQYIKEEDVLQCYDDFRNYPLFFGYNYRDITVDKVKNTIREATRRYGIGFVVLDHLHFLVRNIQHMTNEVGVAIREFKLLAEDEGIPICVVVHPRKVEGNRVPSMVDLRDSGLLAADADIILIVHRKRLRISGEEETEMLFDDTALVRAEKVRYNVGGDSYLHMDGAKSKFSELS